MGYDVWRISVNEVFNLEHILAKPIDMFIVEGVPEWMIPEKIFENTKIKIFWWLSNLFYDDENITKTNFDGIATNSKFDYKKLKNKLNQ